MCVGRAGKRNPWSQVSPIPGISCGLDQEPTAPFSCCGGAPSQKWAGDAEDWIPVQENCRGKLVCLCRVRAWWVTNARGAPKVAPECRRISQVIHKVIPDRAKSQHDHSQKCFQHKRDFCLWIPSEVSLFACGSLPRFSILPVDPF